MKLPLTLSLGAALAAGAIFSAALASSEAASAAFADELSAACLAAVEGGLFQSATAQVDPNGTQSYGVALLKGKPKTGKGTIAAICVYDKATKKVEVSGALPKPAKKTK